MVSNLAARSTPSRLPTPDFHVAHRQLVALAQSGRISWMAPQARCRGLTQGRIAGNRSEPGVGLHAAAAHPPTQLIQLAPGQKLVHLPPGDLFTRNIQALSMILVQSITSHSGV